MKRRTVEHLTFTR